MTPSLSGRQRASGSVHGPPPQAVAFMCLPDAPPFSPEHSLALESGAGYDLVWAAVAESGVGLAGPNECGSGAPTGLAVSEATRLPTPGRCSERLASRDSAPILAKAIARKARLLDCGAARVARILKNSKMCGVTLDLDEANSLSEFAVLKYA